MTRSFVCIASLFAASLLGGCSSLGRIVRQQGTTRAETALLAAGFHIEPADTHDRIVELNTMPPFEVVLHKKGDSDIYAYADPVKCHCEYVGDAQQYAEYKRLRNEQLTAAEQREALALEQNTDIDVSSRGPWAMPW